MALPLSFSLSCSMAGAADTPPQRCNTSISFIKGMATEAVGLYETLGNTTNTPAQVLSWRYLFKVARILASRIAAKVVSVTTFRRPLARRQELSDSMGRFRAMKFLHPNMAVAYGVFRRLPFPAIV